MNNTIEKPNNKFYKDNFARSIGELPKIGQKVLYNDNPTLTPENLECVMIVQDDEIPGIYYAYFKNLDEVEKNTLTENGVNYYTMRGYSNIITID